MAKNLFGTLGMEYTEKTADGSDQEEFIKLAEKHSHRTVPMIFIDNEFIGGFDSLSALAKSGALK